MTSVNTIPDHSDYADNPSGQSSENPSKQQGRAIPAGDNTTVGYAMRGMLHQIELRLGSVA